ncbi:MAG TPA: hypothetical protein VMD99_07275 [Terriglobales bacterium]|nr:hypothetical protein [Terriglobales bacterium]
MRRFRLLPRPKGILIGGSRYCLKKCLEPGLGEALRRLRSASPPAAVSHRVPLGLLLLSRQQLGIEQLRTALARQCAAGQGRIGEWLQALGFVTEQQVTSALARQWSCPVLQADFPSLSDLPRIPAAWLESFAMVPVGYARTRSTLYIAFSEGIDYRALYAIEQIMGCRTEPCMARPSWVRRRLRGLAEHRAEGEVAESEMVFERVTSQAELSRIIRSYAVHLAASEIRLAACGSRLWARLLRPSRPALDLLLHSAEDRACDSPDNRADDKFADPSSGPEFGL